MPVWPGGRDEALLVDVERAGRTSGVEAKVVVASQVEHRYSPKMTDEVRRGFPELVAGDARWARH